MKYIDAEKLIERLEEMKRVEYENRGGVNSKTGALQEVQELIAHLQQEQPVTDCHELKEGLEEEISRTYHDGSVTDTEDIDHVAYENIACHFAEWGAEHLKR